MVMWNKYHGDECQDGALPDGWDVEVGEKESITEPTERGISGGSGTVFVQEPIPRDYCLKKEDVVEHGITNGCAGCRYY